MFGLVRSIHRLLHSQRYQWQLARGDRRRRRKKPSLFHRGRFRFTPVQFGRKETPGTFLLDMDVALATVKWQTAMGYLDNIVIYSKTAEEHIFHVKQALASLQKIREALHLKKCCFCIYKTDCSRDVIQRRKPGIAAHTTNAIMQLEEPLIVIFLRSFLGLCNVLRRFIFNLTRVAAPLNRKLHQHQ